MIIASADSGWTNVFDLPLHERCAPAPPEAVAHIQQVNASRPGLQTEAADADGELRAMVAHALAELPAGVSGRLRDSFLGVYFATGTGSSAVTDIVLSPDSAFLGLIIVLDVDTIRHAGANAWASWRERTPFALSGPLSLDMQIAHPEDDHIFYAVQFLLLHELGHALSAGRGYLPDWWTPVPEHASAFDYAYLPISWRICPDRDIVPLPKDDFALRGRVAYYGAGPQLSDAHMVGLYDALIHTSFLTLYAATSVHEDFADSFACYVHNVLLGKPLSFSIRRHDELVLHWRPDWRAERYAEKFAFFGRLLGGPA